jgi:hypothetical protein
MALHYCRSSLRRFAGGGIPRSADGAIKRYRDFGALRHFNPDLEAEPPAVALEIAEKIDV